MFSLLLLVFISALVADGEKSVMLDYHQLKELRDTIIQKNGRNMELFQFYRKASENYPSWQMPKPEHFQRKPKQGEEVWFFNEDEIWWQTGIVGNMTKGSPEHGVWLAQVSPTQWPGNGGYTADFQKVIYPDKKRVSWQSQKACDLGTAQKEVKDPIMGKRLFNIAKSINEDNVYAYLGLMRWFINRKQWESAYEMFQGCLKVEKRWFLPYMYAGIIKRKQGQAKEGQKQDPTEEFKTSLRHFKEAMELNPGSIEAINNLAHFYYYIDKNHRKSCFWHRLLSVFDKEKTRSVQHLTEHIEECERVQPRYDHEEL